MTKEASRVAKVVAFECGVMETETRLTEEVAGFCRDYCAEVWVESLNRAGIPADSELRRAENVYFPKDIRKAPVLPPPPIADPFPHLEQSSMVQAPPADAEVSKGDGKGKKVQLLTKANQSKDDLTIKDVVSRAKKEESKPKVEDAKLKVVDSKEDPQPTKK